MDYLCFIILAKLLWKKISIFKFYVFQLEIKRIFIFVLLFLFGV